MLKPWFLLLVFGIASSVFAERTDTVYLYNGDRITGEIKFMHDNKLNYKTDRAGVISIEWPSVNRIYSQNFYDIVTISGQRLFGSLKYGNSSGTVVIVIGATSVEKNLSDIISIDRVKTKFFDQLSGSIFLNINYAKANENLQFNTGFDITHRTKKFVNTVSGNVLITSTINTPQSQRNDASYSVQRLYGTRWFLTTALTYQRNTELNIDSRFQLFGGGGIYLLRKASQEMFVVSGITGNREQSIEEPITRTANSEFVLAARFHQFKFRNPQFDILVSLNTYTSLTVPGRIRLDGEVKLMWEIFSDFKWNVTFYENFDRKPPGADGPSNDWNISTGVTYTL